MNATTPQPFRRTRILRSDWRDRAASSAAANSSAHTDRGTRLAQRSPLRALGTGSPETPEAGAGLYFQNVSRMQNTDTRSNSARALGVGLGLIAILGLVNLVACVSAAAPALANRSTPTPTPARVAPIPADAVALTASEAAALVEQLEANAAWNRLYARLFPEGARYFRGKADGLAEAARLIDAAQAKRETLFAGPVRSEEEQRTPASR